MSSHLPYCDLDDAALGGAATPGCPGCRSEAAIAAALDEELAPRSDDASRLQAAIAAALAAAPVHAPEPTPTAGASTGSAWPWIVGAVVVTAVVVGAIASRDRGADETSVVASDEGELEVEPPARDEEPTAIEAPPALDDAVTPPPSDDAVTPADDEVAHDSEVADDGPSTSKRAKRPRRETSLESPADLFARATAARRDGRDREAIDLYRRLLAEHRDSREATVATVALARLLLRTGDAKGALAAFDRYLARSPNGTLAEEAWIGTATAAAALGRREAEAAAWRELLRRFPQTAARDRARRRIEALEPGDADDPAGR